MDAEMERIVEEERVLRFERFCEDSAFAIGSALRERALHDGLSVAIDIRLWDRPLFYAALPGSTGSNPEWTRRKINVVRLFHKSSLRVAREHRREDRIFPPRYGLATEEYVLAGGGFPVHVSTVGTIGAIAVSGLSEREDHDMVVEALRSYLGIQASFQPAGPLQAEGPPV